MIAAERVEDGALRVALPRRAPTPAVPLRRPARVAQLLVLAHQIREAIEDGTYANASAAGDRWGLSRNRMSQVLTLTFLAPDVQLEVLALETVDGVEPPITEKYLFEKVARSPSWKEQREVRARGALPTRPPAHGGAT